MMKSKHARIRADVSYCGVYRNACGCVEILCYISRNGMEKFALVLRGCVTWVKVLLHVCLADCNTM